MLSIILTGRNDNYGGDFETRLFRTLDYNTRLLEAEYIDYEIVFVEWNPLVDKPYISEKLCSRFPKIRSFVVTNKIHKAYCTNPHMPFCEMPAKNLGIRKALGGELIITNADIIFSKKIVLFFKNKRPRENVLYRARRLDISPLQEMHPFLESDLKIIRNGEDRFPPVSYLGAGGDFCFACKSTFETLRGFDESTRFTTRAKDWQFFLHALNRGCRIEFVGDVYHLDHGEGFRNTNPEKRDTEQAHFGAFWNFELRIPYNSSSNWGLKGLEFHSQKNVMEVCNTDGVHKRWLISEDTKDKEELRPSSVYSGRKGAQIMHLLILYKIGLITKNLNFRLLKSDTRGQCELLSKACDYESTKTKDCDSVEIVEAEEVLHIADDSIKNLMPKWEEDCPAFNPFLLKRLLLAYQHFLKNDVKRILLYGAGEHTRELLLNGFPKLLIPQGILVSEGSSTPRFGLPCYSPETVREDDYDGVLLSSVSFESEMKANCLKYKLKNVRPLYESVT